jgi:hypothetical protein
VAVGKGLDRQGIPTKLSKKMCNGIPNHTRSDTHHDPEQPTSHNQQTMPVQWGDDGVTCGLGYGRTDEPVQV